MLQTKLPVLFCMLEHRGLLLADQRSGKQQARAHFAVMPVTAPCAQRAPVAHGISSSCSVDEVWGKGAWPMQCGCALLQYAPQWLSFSC